MSRKTYGHWWPITFAMYDDVDRAELATFLVANWRDVVANAGLQPDPGPDSDITVRWFDSRVDLMDPGFAEPGVEVIAIVEGPTIPSTAAAAADPTRAAPTAATPPVP